MSGFEQVLTYHDRTKHHPQRYARSLGYLDWSTQPDPFRRFAGAGVIPLAVPGDGGGPAYDELFQPGIVPPVPLNADSLSRFFYFSLAISAWKQSGGSRWALRCNPSSGNLHPTEGYAVLPTIAGIGDRPGVYHYAPREHALERRCGWSGDSWNELMGDAPAGAFLVGLSSILWREAWKYGERAFRYCQHDVGHAVGSLRFAAAALGWRLGLLADWGDAEVARLLGLDRDEDFDGAEREHPDLIALVRTDELKSEAQRQPERREVPMRAILMDRLATAEWSGRANRLSAGHVDWEIIDAVATATVKNCGMRISDCGSALTSRDSIGSEPAAGHDFKRLKPARAGLSAYEVIRRRRSAVDFDGRTEIPAATFYHMLSRVLPSAAEPLAPWDTLPWRPRIDLLLFVHRVTGVAPGVYVLAREPARIGALRAAMKSTFEWSRPADAPAGMELHRLISGDARELAAQLSLGQAIAGDSAFSLGMIADFEASLACFGSWFYRHLFWEAGLIGQVLYLEAEAAGVRATGIGAYFDDLVHELVGFNGHAHQSLYHFTVGGPVEDPRITTLPAYSA